MKYRVVGWTHYEDDSVEETECSEAALQAIIAEIQKKGYNFTGWHHQESSYCAPVLNDGKKRLFSQRGFGGVMAMAKGDFSPMGYAGYAFYYFDEEQDASMKMPTSSQGFNPILFKPETDLNEEIALEVTEEIFKGAEGGNCVLPDCEIIRFLDVGDTLTLVCGEKKSSYLVTDLERRRDLTEEEMQDVLMARYDIFREGPSEAEIKYTNANWVVEVTLK